MKWLLNLIKNILIISTILLVGFGFFIFVRYSQTSAGYTKCVSQYKNVSIDSYIQQQNLTISAQTSSVDIVVPYEYVLYPVLKKVQDFDLQTTGIPDWGLTILAKLGDLYKLVYKQYPKYRGKSEWEAVCAKRINNNTIRVFASKTWWAWLETDVKVQYDKVSIENIKIDSIVDFESKTWLSLLNGSGLDIQNFIPQGVKVSFSNEGIVLTYSVQSLMIKP